MNAKYYQNLAAEAGENPSYWFSGLRREHLPATYRDSVPDDAEKWDLWSAILSVLDDAASGDRFARRWVLRTITDYQTQETVSQLSETDDTDNAEKVI